MALTTGGSDHRWLWPQVALAAGGSGRRWLWPQVALTTGGGDCKPHPYLVTCTPRGGAPGFSSLVVRVIGGVEAPRPTLFSLATEILYRVQGVSPVTLAGGEVTRTSRDSSAMFTKKRLISNLLRRNYFSRPAK